MDDKNAGNFIERFFEGYYNAVLGFFKKIKILESEKFFEKIEKYFFGVVGLIAIAIGGSLFFYNRWFENQDAKYIILFAILSIFIFLIEIFRKKDSWLAFIVYFMTIFLGCFGFIFKFDNMAISFYVLSAIFVFMLFFISIIYNRLILFLIATFIYFAYIYFAYTAPVDLLKREGVLSFFLYWHLIFLFVILTFLFFILAYLLNKSVKKLESKNLSAESNSSKAEKILFNLFFALNLFSLPFDYNFIFTFLVAMTNILFGLVTKTTYFRLFGFVLFLFSLYKILFKYWNMQGSISVNDTVFIMAFGVISLLIFFIYKKLECKSLASQK